jgi:hypothetical protein
MKIYGGTLSLKVLFVTVLRAISIYAGICGCESFFILAHQEIIMLVKRFLFWKYSGFRWLGFRILFYGIQFVILHLNVILHA